MTTPDSRPPRHRGRRRRPTPRLPRIIALAVVAVLVLAAAVHLLGRGPTGTSPAAAPSATASVAPPAAGDNVINADGKVTTDTPVKAGTTSKGAATKTGTTVALPAELGDRPLLTDPDYVGLGAGLDIKLDGVPAGAATIGGVYGNPTAGDIVLVAAAATDLATPAATLNTAFINAAVGGLPLTGVTDVPPGPLGGSAQCGKAEAGGANLVMCGWADASSTGRIVWYFTSLKTARAEFTKLRAQIEKPSN